MILGKLKTVQELMKEADNINSHNEFVFKDFCVSIAFVRSNSGYMFIIGKNNKALLDFDKNLGIELFSDFIEVENLSKDTRVRVVNIAGSYNAYLSGCTVKDGFPDIETFKVYTSGRSSWTAIPSDIEYRRDLCFVEEDIMAYGKPVNFKGFEKGESVW